MILVIDNQSQFIRHLLERLDAEDIPYKVRRNDDYIHDPNSNNIHGVILSGGLGNPFGPLNLFANYISIDRFQNIPILGICLGMEIIAAKFCGIISPTNKKQDKLETIYLNTNSVEDPLLEGLPPEFDLKESHSWYVSYIGDDLISLAFSAPCPHEIIKHRTRPLYGIQSHPELPESGRHGYRIITNFLKICGF